MRDLSPLYCRRKTLVVNSFAIRIRARRRISLMQRQPLLGLLDAVVVELVVDLARAQRFDQVAPHGVGELTGTNEHIGSGHDELLAETEAGCIRIFTERY